MDLPPRREPRSPLDAINVTPLVDVMLVLLIVFLVTVSLGQEGITVALPRAESAALAAEETLTVSISADLRIFINTTEVAEDNLSSSLTSLLSSLPTKTVFLKADQSVPYGDFARIVGRIQASGAVQLGMLTEPLEE